MSYDAVMRLLPAIGALLLVLGIASLFVPIPRSERHGVESGDVSLGIETTSRQKVHPAISAVLIAGGVALMFASRGRRRA